MTASTESPGLPQSVVERTRITASNGMDLLLFSLCGGETYGINVLDVMEVACTPPLTHAPNLPPGVAGVTGWRGMFIPVIALAAFMPGSSQRRGQGIMMVTESSRHTQGLLVHEVDRIVRVEWDAVRAHCTANGEASVVTAIAELPDGKRVSIPDIELVIANVYGEKVVAALAGADAAPGKADEFAAADPRTEAVITSAGRPTRAWHDGLSNGPIINGNGRADAVTSRKQVGGPLYGTGF
jgi:two-component system chemotaxis response regulator CheV